MSCMKTGAVIFVDSENAYFRCDHFELYGINYFRITTASLNRGVSDEAPYATVHDFANWFDQFATYSTLICGPGDVEFFPK